MNPIETIVILLYCVVVVGIGVATRGRITSEISYYLADRRLGTFFAGMGRFAAVSSAFSFFGALGLGYIYGLPYLMSIGLGLTFGFLLTLLLLSELRNSDSVSISDFLTRRFRRRAVQVSAAIISLLVMFPTLVAQLRGASVLGEVVIGIPGGVAIVIATVVFTSYVVMGGMWAVSWTNMFQGVLLVIFMMIPAGLALYTFNGFELIQDAGDVAQHYLAGTAELSVWSHFGIAVTFVGSMMTFPAYVFWSFTTNSVSVLRKSIVITIILACLVYTSWILVLGAAFIIDPNLTDPDAVYFVVVNELAGNPLVFGLAGAAAFSAMMSTTDGLLVATSSIVARDIWGVIRPRDAWRRGAVAGRVATVVISAAALVFAFYTPAFVGELISSSAASAGAAFVFPLVLGIWWRRINHVGALSGMLGGYVTFMGLTYLADLPLNIPILLALPVSAVLCVAGSLLTGSPEREQTDFADGLHIHTEETRS